MEYRLEKCPRCHLTPVEEHELSGALERNERTALDCRHCGARLWAQRIEGEEGLPDRVIFLLRTET